MDSSSPSGAGNFGLISSNCFVCRETSLRDGGSCKPTCVPLGFACIRAEAVRSHGLVAMAASPMFPYVALASLDPSLCRPGWPQTSSDASSKCWNNDMHDHTQPAPTKTDKQANKMTI